MAKRTKRSTKASGKRPPRDTGFEKIKREALKYGVRPFATLAGIPHTTAYKALHQRTPDNLTVGVYRVLVTTASKLHTKRKGKPRRKSGSPKQTPNPSPGVA